MRTNIVPALVLMLFVLSNPASAGDQEIEQLQQQLEQLKLEYNNKIEELEKRLQATEIATQQKKNESKENKEKAKQQMVPVVAEYAPADDNAAGAPVKASKSDSFNPAISLILDGRYSDFSEDPEEYSLSGFQLAGEAVRGGMQTKKKKKKGNLGGSPHQPSGWLSEHL